MSRKSSYVCSLTKRSQEKAAVELHETPETRGPAIERLRKAVVEYPGLTCPTDDLYLLRFLRARKFDEDRALQMIVQTYRVRNELPEIYSAENWRPSLVRKIAEAGYRNVLPCKDKEGRTILWARFGVWETDLCPFLDITRYDLMDLERTLLDDEEFQVNGVVAILDFENFGMMKALNMTPSVMKMQARIFQDVMPIRIKEVHYINEPAVMGYLFPLIKRLAKKKLLDRIFFHGCDLNDLHKSISPDLLPPELGGTLSDWPEQHKKMVDAFFAREDEYIAMQKYKLVEDTPGVKGEDIKQDAMQGMSGTFRKINLD